MIKLKLRIKDLREDHDLTQKKISEIKGKLKELEENNVYLEWFDIEEEIYKTIIQCNQQLSEINNTKNTTNGLFTKLDYEKALDDNTINLTLPQDMKTVLHIPTGATVNINSQAYYQNGEYVNGEIGNVEIVEK